MTQQLPPSGTAPAVVPLRQRLPPEVRVLQILDAALVEFSERGFAAARMDDIARRAEAAVRTSVAHGFTAIRTHVDIGPDIGPDGVHEHGASTNRLVSESVAYDPITGQSLQSYLYSGANIATWGTFKSFVGVVQPYYLTLYGHSSQSGSTVDGYKTYLEDAVAKATSDIGAPLKVIHLQTGRYADASNAGGSDGVQVRTVREAQRKRVFENPTEWLGGSFHHLKCDSNDTGPHPMDGNTGQGRAGAGFAWAVMECCRAVEDQPLTITAATLLSGGTVLELTLDKVNA